MTIQEKFSAKISVFFKQPKLWSKTGYLFGQQAKAVKIRQKWKQKGVAVPPMIIFSITNKCNLNCAGCYHRALKRQEENLPTEEIIRILDEARDLGVSIVLVAGGEPFIRKDLMVIIQKFPEILFVVFTNGVLISKGMAEEIKRLKNTVPIISIEGGENKTDKRRGKGTFGRLESVFPLFKGGFLGISFTVTRDNLPEITDEKLIGEMIKKGILVFFYVEYVPFEKGTENMVLDKKERKILKQKIDSMKKKLPAAFISFPGDEEEFGGCLAAGRGFLHISPAGEVEPCPFSPYSDVSLKKIALKEALNSKLFKKIRKMPKNLKEISGGCALFANRDKIKI